MKKKNQKVLTKKNVLIYIAVVLVIIAIGALWQSTFADKSKVNNEGIKSIEGNNGEYDYGTEKGKVIVKYVDEEGKEIASSETIKGILGTEYKTTRKNIDHYTSNGEEPVNKVGNYRRDDVIVTYVYKTLDGFVSIQNEKNEVTVQVANEKINSEYNLRVIQKAKGEDVKLTGGEFKLKDESQKELASGVTTNGSLLLGSLNVNKEGLKTYLLEEISAPKGYAKKLQADYGLKITAKWNEEDKKFEIELDSDTIEDVTAEIVNNEIVVTIENEKEKSYDLAMKLVATKIDGESTGRTIKAKTNAEGQIIYEENKERLEVADSQKVTYELRVYNEETEEMEIGTITNTLPDGLNFIEDSEVNKKFEWKAEGKVLTTDYYKTTKLDGFKIGESTAPAYEKLELEVEVSADEVSEDEDEITNKSEIEADEKETNKDNNNAEYTINLVRHTEPDDPEKVVSDLSVKKFLYSIDGEKTKDREVTAKIEDGKVVYTKNNEMEKVSNDQKLVYTLRTFNLDEKETQGREITEQIPEGLEFIPDSEINKANGWKMYKKDETGNLVEVTDAEDAIVVKTSKPTEETIEGKLNYKDTQVEFKVNEDKVTDENRIVTNVVKLKDSIEDPNDGDDEDEEKVQVKVFDLNVTKYIESITIKDDESERVKELGLAQRGKLFKAEVHKKKINQTKVYVTYGLKVKNIGEIAGYATELTDYIPEDFKLVDDTNTWTTSGVVAKTTALANTLIEPGDSRTINITFVWELNEDNLGLRNNMAVISGYKNDYDAKDNTPDKDNEDKFIISIKTGAFEIAIIVVVVALMGVAIIITKK